jgi:hypothetical protein
VLMLFGIRKEVVRREESYCGVITKPILLANGCQYEVLLTTGSIYWSMAQVICKRFVFCHWFGTSPSLVLHLKWPPYPFPALSSQLQTWVAMFYELSNHEERTFCLIGPLKPLGKPRSLKRGAT